MHPMQWRGSTLTGEATATGGMYLAVLVLQSPWRSKRHCTNRKAYMSSAGPRESALATHTCALYRRALLALQASQVPFLVGGAYALAHYTGIDRDTKDVDIFVHPSMCAHTLEVLRITGYYTEL